MDYGGETISISWSIDDVLEVAPDLTKEECMRVLNLAEHNHDANVGINWEVLEIWADIVRDERNGG